MDNNKIIIIALIVIIVVLLGAIFAMMPNMFKQDTNLKFKGNSTLKQGDYLKIKLTDDNGTAIANQTINITITDEDDVSEYHSVITNDKGAAAIQFENDPGKYKIMVIYGGSDKYNSCNATKKITIEEEAVEAEVDYSSQSQTSSGNPYSVDNLPPSNDPYPETSREQVDENYVMQKYEDGYISYVDLRTGERTSGGFAK